MENIRKTVLSIICVFSVACAGSGVAAVSEPIDGASSTVATSPVLLGEFDPGADAGGPNNTEMTVYFRPVRVNFWVCDSETLTLSGTMKTMYQYSADLDRAFYEMRLDGTIERNGVTYSANSVLRMLAGPHTPTGQMYLENQSMRIAGNGINEWVTYKASVFNTPDGAPGELRDLTMTNCDEGWWGQP